MSMSDEELTNVARQAARANGCTCIPDITLLPINIEGLEGLPSLGAKIGLRVGYRESGLVEKGEFVIIQRTPYLFPMRLVIVATAAPFSVMDQSGYRQRRSASEQDRGCAEPQRDGAGRKRGVVQNESGIARDQPVLDFLVAFALLHHVENLPPQLLGEIGVG